MATNVVNPNELLSPAVLTELVKERPGIEKIRATYLWRDYFPPKEVPQRTLTWDSVREENNLAGIYASKGRSIPGTDDMFRTHFARLIDVKASRFLDTDIVNKLRDPGMPAVYREGLDSSFVIKDIANRVVDHVTKAVVWADNAVEATLEYMAVNAMRGTINWPPTDANGAAITPPMPHWNADAPVSFAYNKYANFDQTATGLTGYGGRLGKQIAWNADGADPIRDLELIAQLMDEQEGLDMDGADVIISRGTLSDLARSATYLNWFGGTTMSQPDARDFLATYNAIQNFIKTNTGLNIRLYRAGWTYRSKVNGVTSVNRVRFLPDGEVLIVPAEAKPVGSMAFAPHETSDGSFAFGKVVNVYRDERTFDREIEVKTVAFPLAERGMEVFRLKAYE